MVYLHPPPPSSLALLTIQPALNKHALQVLMFFPLCLMQYCEKIICTELLIVC